MLSNKFKEVIRNLESNIQNPSDLEYAKKQVTELTMLYLDELNKIEKIYDLKILQCFERIEDIEKTVERIDEINEQFNKEDIIDDHYDIEPITCPYCNIKFLIDLNDMQSAVKCPACTNIIELDWKNYEDNDDM